MRYGKASEMQSFRTRSVNGGISAVLLVLDTSVVLKWFADEENTEKALEIKEDFLSGEHEIVVPDLLRYELSNAMRYTDGFDHELISESLSNLKDLDIDIVVPTNEVMELAAKIAMEQEITFYDAVFIALADHIDARLITSDQELADKTQQDFKVQKLAEY